jgi:futalosine hydrolase
MNFTTAKNMKLLIVAATALEIAPFAAKNTGIDILITGVGSPACMYALSKKLQTNKYDFVIQAGIAGTFKNNFALGKTYVVKKDVYADLGIAEKENFTTLFETNFADPNAKPYKDGWLENEQIRNFGLQEINGITVNTVSDNFAVTNLYRKKFDADIESMEGAAFHYVCICEHISFLQIRSISNFVGERIKTNWKIKEAIDNLNENLIMIVKNLSEQHVTHNL